MLEHGVVLLIIEILEILYEKSRSAHGSVVDATAQQHVHVKGWQTLYWYSLHDQNPGLYLE